MYDYWEGYMFNFTSTYQTVLRIGGYRTVMIVTSYILYCAGQSARPIEDAILSGVYSPPLVALVPIPLPFPGW
jgi:hypothetical protein